MKFTQIVNVADELHALGEDGQVYALRSESTRYGPSVVAWKPVVPVPWTDAEAVAYRLRGTAPSAIARQLASYKPRVSGETIRITCAKGEHPVQIEQSLSGVTIVDSQSNVVELKLVGGYYE